MSNALACHGNSGINFWVPLKSTVCAIHLRILSGMDSEEPFLETKVSGFLKSIKQNIRILLLMQRNLHFASTVC